MKARNMAASRPAAMFSARRRSQAPLFSRNEGILGSLLQAVDLVEHARRPGFRQRGLQVLALRERAEGLHIGRVDIEASGLEEADQLLLLLQVFSRAPGECLFRRSAHPPLLRGRERIVDLRPYDQQAKADVVRGQGDLACDL